MISKYLDLARELKKLWNMKMMVISNVIGVLRTVLKSLKKKLSEPATRGRIKIIQTTALIKSARIN